MKSRLFTYDEAMRSPPGEPLSLLTQWMTEYPMNAHPELGAEADTHHPAPVPAQPVLVHLTPDAGEPHAAETEVERGPG